MADYTENLRLVKPSGNEYYNVEQFNHNAELIDKKIGEMDTSLTEIKTGATREKPGIVQYGAEEGKALEGMMLARLAGAHGYGGDIQDDGVKNQNYIYYDRNTKKMYKCLKQNQDISANVTNFIPMDNFSILERLENLLKFRDITLIKDLDSNLFSRYIGKIPQDIAPSKIISVILEEGSGAPGGYSVYRDIIAAFYYNYQISNTRKAKIVYY